jgi:hypothetical protein
VAFKGLFIGIDRYASTEINWLNCASRDAIALHALFTDTLGGDATLLADERRWPRLKNSLGNLPLVVPLSSPREDYAFVAFERLFRERGLPANIRSDNGVPFASAHALFNLSNSLSGGYVWGSASNASNQVLRSKTDVTNACTSL